MPCGYLYKRKYPVGAHAPPQLHHQCGAAVERTACSGPVWLGLLTAAYVAVCAATIAGTSHEAFVPAVSPDEDPLPAVQQWAFSALCPGGIDTTHGCGGCTQLYGPPDAGSGCGFSCQAATIRIRGLRAGSVGVRNDTAVELFQGMSAVRVNLAWDLDPTRAITLSVYEPWTIDGRGAVRRVELLHDDVRVLRWSDADTTPCGGSLEIDQWQWYESDDARPLSINGVRVFVGATHTSLGTVALPFIDAIGVRGHPMYADTPVVAWVAQALVFTLCGVLPYTSIAIACEGLSTERNFTPTSKHLVAERVSRKFTPPYVLLWFLIASMGIAIVCTLPYPYSLDLWGQYWVTDWLPAACIIVYAMLLCMLGLYLGVRCIVKHRLAVNITKSAAAAKGVAWHSGSRVGVRLVTVMMWTASLMAQAVVVSHVLITTLHNRGAGWATDAWVLGVALLSLPLCFATSQPYLRVVFARMPTPTAPPPRRVARTNSGKQAAGGKAAGVVVPVLTPTQLAQHTVARSMRRWHDKRRLGVVLARMRAARATMDVDAMRARAADAGVGVPYTEHDVPLLFGAAGSGGNATLGQCRPRTCDSGSSCETKSHASTALVTTGSVDEQDDTPALEVRGVTVVDTTPAPTPTHDCTSRPLWLGRFARPRETGGLPLQTPRTSRLRALCWRDSGAAGDPTHDGGFCASSGLFAGRGLCFGTWHPGSPSPLPPAVPSTWHNARYHVDPEGTAFARRQCALPLVPEGSPEWNAVVRHLKETSDGDEYDVTVRRVQNAALWRRHIAYVAEVRAQVARCTGTASHVELPMWHGSSLPNIEAICDHGFRTGKCKRSAYGRGIYVASTSKLAHTYASPQVRNTQALRTHCLVLCRVVVGIAAPGRSHAAAAYHPAKATTTGLDERTPAAPPRRAAAPAKFVPLLPAQHPPASAAPVAGAASGAGAGAGAGAAGAGAADAPVIAPPALRAVNSARGPALRQTPGEAAAATDTVLVDTGYQHAGTGKGMPKILVAHHDAQVYPSYLVYCRKRGAKVSSGKQ